MDLFVSLKNLLLNESLSSELFYHFENRIIHEGKPFSLKYFKSFALEQEVASSPFKIYPKSHLNTFNPNLSLSEATVAEKSPSLGENIFEVSKVIKEEESFKKYLDASSKYFIYKKYHGLVGLPSENEQLLEEFKL